MVTGAWYAVASKSWWEDADKGEPNDAEAICGYRSSDVGKRIGGDRLAETGKAEKSAPLYGEHGVSPQAVLQGSLGSCYFHGAIAALAKGTPETLRGAIHENPGGGYRVHFFSGPEEVVFPEDVEFGRAHAYDRSEGTWVGVLMRAYAQRALRQSLVGAIQKSDMIPVFTKPIALTLLDESDLPLVAYDRAVRAVVQQDGVLDKATLKTKLAAQLATLGVPATEAQMLGDFLNEQGFFDSVSKTVEQNGEVFGAYKSLGQGGVPGWVFEAFLGKSEVGTVADKKLTIGELQQLHAGKVAVVVQTWATPPNEEVRQGELVGSPRTPTQCWSTTMPPRP